MFYFFVTLFNIEKHVFQCIDCINMMKIAFLSILANDEAAAPALHRIIMNI